MVHTLLVALAAALLQPVQGASAEESSSESGLPAIHIPDTGTTERVASFDDTGSGDQPRQYRCVGDPPRQTEDPMSPPCEPFFDGDNGGATSPGVTGDEITVVAYFDRGAYASETSPWPGSFTDVDGQPKPACPETWPASNPDVDECDHVLIRSLRALSGHFNSRFNFHGRRIHLWAYFATGGSAAARRADAEAIWEQKTPFAILDFATFEGFNGAFVDAAGDLGMVAVEAEAALSNAFHAAGAPYSWTFDPAIEIRAEQYASYVCQKVVPYPVAHGGGDLFGSQLGQPRTYGLYYTRDPSRPDLRRFADLTKERLADCGINTYVEATFERAGFVVDNDDQGTDQLQAVATFKTQGVTTVLWLGGVEGKFSHTAALLGYYPEIVLAGDGDLDGNGPGRIQNQAVWRNAWGVQYQIREDGSDQSYGARAARDGDPAIDDDALYFAQDMYREVFLLASGVQLADPDLNPSSFEAGFRSVPPHESDSPYRAACTYPEGDFSCIDDAMEVWWDPAGVPPGGTTPGCMRMVREGGRFLPGAWEGGDDVFDEPSDPCTSYPGSTRIRP